MFVVIFILALPISLFLLTLDKKMPSRFKSSVELTAFFLFRSLKWYRVQPCITMLSLYLIYFYSYLGSTQCVLSIIIKTNKEENSNHLQDMSFSFFFLISCRETVEFNVIRIMWCTISSFFAIEQLRFSRISLTLILGLSYSPSYTIASFPHGINLCYLWLAFCVHVDVFNDAFRLNFASVWEDWSFRNLSWATLLFYAALWRPPLLLR